MGKPRTICPTHWIGDMVSLKVDDDSAVGMITAISITSGDHYLYKVSWGNTEDSLHFDIELEMVQIEEKSDA